MIIDVDDYDDQLTCILYMLYCITTAHIYIIYIIYVILYNNSSNDAIRDSSLSFLTFAKLLKTYLVV